MKLLAVKVGGNVIDTLDFERDDFTNSFILNTNEEVTLLSFPLVEAKNAIIFQDTSGQRLIYPNSLSVIKSSYDEHSQTNKVELEMEFGYEPNDNINRGLIDENRLFVFNEGKLTYNNGTDQDNLSEVTVIIILHEGDNERHTHRTTRTFFVSEAERVDDVVLDFGSEATQLSIRNRSSRGNVRDIINLFDEMWGWNDLHDTNTNHATDQCMQRDASDTRLYRSRYFVKKIIDNDCLNDPYKKPNENEVIKLLTFTNEGEDLRSQYINLPNTKIASFGGVSFDKIDIHFRDQNGTERVLPTPVTDVRGNFFYRSSINAFLRKAVHSIILRNTQLPENSNVRLISFHILMPNVYDYCKLHEMINVMKNDLWEIIEDINSEIVGSGIAGSRIVGFEIDAVSESDASLLGNVALSNPAQFPQGRYLILDAGRGTLDFSIVNHNNTVTTNNFQNLYRDGIIGAGNAISYAILLVILEGLKSSENAGGDNTGALREYIFSNILGIGEEGRARGGGDSAKLVELMELVDKYKMMYPSLTDHNFRPLDLNCVFAELRLDGLINKIKFIIEHHILVRDTQQYLDRTMRQLADTVVTERLKERFGDEGGDTNTPDYVVFAGRGFLFQPFKNMMLTSLKECFPNIIEKHFTCENISDKNVCLVISEHIRNGNYDNRLLGQPYMLHSVPAVNNVAKSEESKQNKAKSVWGRILSVIRSIGKNSNDFSDVVEVTVKYQPQQEMSLYDYSKGVSLRVKFANDKILIGNTSYPVANAGLQLRCDFELFFGNGKIWVRQNGRMATQLQGGDNYSGNRIFESMFPYVSVNDVNDVAIPAALGQQMENAIPENNNEPTIVSNSQREEDDARL